ITVAAAGLNTAFTDSTALEFTATVPVTAQFVLTESIADVLASVILLKVVNTDPPIVCEDVPLNVIVLVFAVNVAPLFVQFPATVCVKGPALIVVPEPRTTFPPTPIAAATVTDADPLV